MKYSYANPGRLEDLMISHLLFVGLKFLTMYR